MAYRVITKDIVIKSKQGLHARPAALFVQIANKFDSDISIIKDGEEVNGKSIMGILMLAAEKGARICLKAAGSDAENAIEELEKILIEDRDDSPDLKKV
jgi:phosphocarrier protein HPr